MVRWRSYRERAAVDGWLRLGIRASDSEVAGDENDGAGQRCRDGGGRDGRRPLYPVEQC
jgi:hypothetical protein